MIIIIRNKEPNNKTHKFFANKVLWYNLLLYLAPFEWSICEPNKTDLIQYQVNCSPIITLFIALSPSTL